MQASSRRGRFAMHAAPVLLGVSLPSSSVYLGGLPGRQAFSPL